VEMVDQREKIASDCLEAVGAAIEFCESCSDQDWNAITSEEGWPVAAVIRHIIEAGPVLIGFAQEMAAGRDVSKTMPEIDTWNASQLPEWSKTTRAEAITGLRQVGDRAANAVRSYSDEQLAGEHTFAIYGETRTTARMAQGFALHVNSHLENARAATT